MAKRKNITKLLGRPPLEKKTAALNVEIDGELSLRLKLALLHLECEGTPVPKKAFVEEAIVQALDRFDAKRSV